MKKIILFSLLFFSLEIFACKCVVLQPISKELTADYDVIFLGKVDSVSTCSDNGMAIAYFKINELYKGNTEQQIKINFDCASSCMMSFAQNDEWLIYAKYQRFDVLQISICEHSRKLFQDTSLDLYQLNAKRTFDEEKGFLKSTLGVQTFIKNNDLNKQQSQLAPRNEQPSVFGKMLLLLISFVVMLGVFLVMKNKKKDK